MTWYASTDTNKLAWCAGGAWRVVIDAPILATGTGPVIIGTLVNGVCQANGAAFHADPAVTHDARMLPDRPAGNCLIG